LAALLEIGFERGPSVPDRLDERRLASGDWKLVFARAAMSTRVSIAAIHPSLTCLEEATGRAFEEMDRVIDLLNRFDSRSAVAVLNADGRLVGPPPELELVLDQARVIHRLTGGAFDVTVGPLVDLLHRSPQLADGGSPDQGEWREALALIDADALRLDHRRVSFAKQDMGITLDGIAKGFIVDGMAATLEAHGVRRYLIDAGGDIRASGLRENGRGWGVAVRDPLGEGVLPGVAEVTGGAIATSGGYEAFFDPEGSWHHIVSGRTGRSSNEVLSVTVHGPNTLAADALATAVFLEGPRGGLRLIDSMPGFECLVIGAGGRIHPSAGWSRLTSSADREGRL
jgi:thiamine biosynthesis lipoprotein